LLRKLAGTGQASLKNIEFRGWDLSASVRDGFPLVGTSHWAQGQGRFSLLDEAIHVETLRLDEAKVKAELYGEVSFAKIADLKFSASVSGKRISGGTDTTRVVKISGPLGAPNISVETRIQ
jgi:hypothetical protein